MPRRAQWHHRLAALAALLGLVVAPHLWLAPSAGAAAGFGPVSGAGKGRTLSEFVSHVVCEGQQQADALGYAPLPVNLVQAGLPQVNQIPRVTGKVNNGNLANCRNPTLAADSTDQLIRDVPPPQPCDLTSAPTRCIAGTDGMTTPAATTVTLNVSPAGPLAANTVQTLTAAVHPPAVGSVQFKEGTSNIGGPVAVSGGTASTTTTLAPGNHALTAVFTPTDPAALGPVTSPATSATVGAPAGAKATTTTFTVIPSGPVLQGVPVILVAQVAPANAAGMVQFLDGDTPVGTPRPVFGGFALTVTSQLPKGTHSLTATFTPANPATFAPSALPAVSLTVTGLS
jgi:Bacterial Ig-like domain (group 3)